jgi:YD repeat-containing protein
MSEAPGPHATQALLEDQSERWRRGERVPVEDLLAGRPRLWGDAEAVLDLITNEVLLRQQAGEAPLLEEYQRRFPHLAEPLRLQFEVEQAFQGSGPVRNTLPPEPTLISPGSPAGAEAGPPAVAGYEVLGELGRGGMGVVYRARQHGLNRVVALKMIRGEAHAGADERARFRTEAEAIARLQHPNIVQVFEVGEHEGRPFLSLELCPGGSLADRLRGAPLSGAEATRLVEMLARAVQAAHDAQVIHRDLKPANVLLAVGTDLPVCPDRPGGLSPQFTPKITDFGLARKLDEAGQTVSGAVLGTPSYMAPEQAAGKGQQVGPAADVYALGAILYECLTGRPPFKAATIYDTLLQVIGDEPVPVRRLQPGVPHDLETICLKCLRKEPKQRYASAAELAEDLRRFLADEPIQARPVRAWERLVKGARRRPAVALAMVLGALLLCGVGSSWWFWHQGEQRRRQAHERERAEAEAQAVHVEYYANFVKRWGAPAGIGPLTEQQLRRRWISYKFYRRGGRVEKVEVVNGLGLLTTWHGVPVFIGQLPASDDSDVGGRHDCRFEYRRNQQGQVIEEVASDQNDTVIWAFHYTRPTTGYFTDARGFPSPRAGSGATYVELVFSPDGLEQEVHYLDRNDKPRADGAGYFGERRQFDRRGLPVQTTYLGPPSPSGAYRDGHLKATRVYDDQGNVLEVAYFGLDGKPRVLADGYARVTYAYDEHGNNTAVAYFGLAGEPVVNKEGVARETRRFDDRGNWIEQAYFGPDGKPTLDRNQVARFKAKYDERGYVTRGDWFGKDGKLTLHKNGMATVITVNDDRGNATDVALFGVDSKPTLHRAGYARITKVYDRRGNVIESALFGLDGKPILDKEGRARTTSVYDEQGKLLERAFFGIDGKPALFRQSYARFKRAYDERGNVIETTLFGVDGKLAIHRDGYSRWTAAYDEYGNRTESAHFGPDGKPTLNKDRVSRWTEKHDANRNLIEVAYFGVDGKPALSNKEGHHKFTARYDERGNRTEAAFFGLDGNPTLHKEGYARWAAEYDERGNQTRLAYFGLDGKPTRHKDGHASWTMKYDPRGNRVEENYFGLDGKPTLNVDGYARLTAQFDRRGNRIAQAYFGLDGKPTRHNDGNAHQVTSAYDERGNQTEEAYFGLDGKPCLMSGGYARITWVSDLRGNKIEEVYYGVDGKPALHKDGYAKTTRKYDARGNESEVAFFGRDGKPILHQEGYARWTARYDERDNQREVAYFGVDGKPISGKGGYARSTAEYKAGTQVDAAYFDVAGKRLRVQVVVVAVAPGSQADRLGIRVGDVLTSYLNREVPNVYKFIAWRSAERGTEKKRLDVLRAGRPLRFDVTPGPLGLELEDRVVP